MVSDSDPVLTGMFKRERLWLGNGANPMPSSAHFSGARQLVRSKGVWRGKHCRA